MTHNVIFTDGASRGNPGPGGWGAIVVFTDKVKELGGGSKKTTNNRMELLAAIEALKEIEKNQSVLVYTDSSYVLKGSTAWLPGWKKNGWKTKAKEDVLNIDLWKKMDQVLSGVTVSWKLLPGHSGIAGNERCDEIATAFADEKKPKLYSGPLSSYGLDISFVAPGKISQKKKNSNKGKAYSYVSMVEGVIKIHATWEECESQVRGKSKALFKKAFSAEDEKAIIASWKKTSRA